MNDIVEDNDVEITQPAEEGRIRQLASSVRRRAPLDAVVLLERENDATIAAVLDSVDPELATRLLSHISNDRSENIVAKIKSSIGEQWAVNLSYPEDSVGRHMEPPVPYYYVTDTVQDVVESLRIITQKHNVVYAFAVDQDMHLLGIIVMRDLLLAEPLQTLDEIMISEPFYFEANTSIENAMKAVLLRHYPIYPVCDEARVLLGFVHGYALFEQTTFQLTAMPGTMVGVEEEEHISTPWLTCLRYRHPWLQLNLLTALMAGFVVGMFEDTIARVVVLAAFLPVLAGQSGNTGCQALAVTLRGMTLNELKPGMERSVVTKEAMLGLSNGLLVGITAGICMYIYASFSHAGSPLLLAFVVFLAMIGACVASGMVGVLVPLTLRRFGTDPATASTIFLTTATDIVSMGLMLALATIMI